MWQSMFTVQIPIVEKVLRTVMVYATILILFRLAGKRDLATLNVLDFGVFRQPRCQARRLTIGSPPVR